MGPLIFLNSLGVGGAERSCIKLANELTRRGSRVTVLLLRGGGRLQSELSPQVRCWSILPRDGYLSPTMIIAWPRTLWCCLRVVLHRWDSVIIGVTGAKAVIPMTLARSKSYIHFVRSDLSRMRRREEIIATLSKYATRYRAVVAVSKTALDSLLEAMPELEAKAYLIYNLLGADSMIRASQDPTAPTMRMGAGVQIVSLCRLSEHSKGLARMARICRNLKERGHIFTWHLVGDGPDRAMLEELIVEYGISQQMILYGELQNPYRILASADLVAMVSRYEGLCGVINESKVFSLPLVATEVSGIFEQLVDGDGGIVCPQDEVQIEESLSRVIRDAPLRRALANDHLNPGILCDESKIVAIESIIDRAG